MEYKGYEIVNDNKFGYKNIKPIGKGSVPMDLRGSYTTYDFAKQAIDALEAIKNVKPTKSAGA